MIAGRYHVTVLHERHLEAIERFVQHHGGDDGERSCVRTDELAAMRELVRSARAPFVLDVDAPDPEHSSAELWVDGEHRATIGDLVSADLRLPDGWVAVPIEHVLAARPGRGEGA